MKNNVSEQLKDYIKKIGKPDEQILCVEKIVKMDLTIGIFAVVFSVGVLAAVSAMFFTEFAENFLIVGIIFTIMLLVPLIIMFSALIGSQWLVLTSRAVYFCTGANTELVFCWSFSEIAMVECKQERIRITSTYLAWEAGTEPVKTFFGTCKNFMLRLFGKPVERKQYSMTQLFVRPRDSQGNAELTHRLYVVFRMKANSSMPHLLAQTAKKYPDVKVGIGNAPIE